MDIDFNGKVYLITGGASGIGAAVVHYLAQHNGSAVIADINEDAGEALVAQINDLAVFYGYVYSRRIAAHR